MKLDHFVGADQYRSSSKIHNKGVDQFNGGGSLSYRDVEELLAERGIDVSNETVRRWFLKFGRLIAGNLRCSCPHPSPRWHLDEMVIKIRDRK